MWIGIALVITASGSFVTQAVPFFTEAECRAQSTYAAAELAKSENARAYRLDCINGDTLTKKPPPKTDAVPKQRAPVPPRKPEISL
jgi:hypothetical protein